MNGLPVASVLPAQLPDAVTDRLAALFDVHHDRLYRLARRMSANPDDALDLVQETFLRAARSPGSVPSGTSSEEAWLLRVLINICRDQWRKAAVRRRHDRPPHDDGDTGHPEPALLARAAVWRALDTLKPRRRAVLVMHELDGVPIATIASLLGISAITVRWHLSTGRRELARALAPHIGASHADR